MSTTMTAPVTTSSTPRRLTPSVGKTATPAASKTANPAANKTATAATTVTSPAIRTGPTMVSLKLITSDNGEHVFPVPNDLLLLSGVPFASCSDTGAVVNFNTDSLTGDLTLDGVAIAYMLGPTNGRLTFGTNPTAYTTLTSKDVIDLAPQIADSVFIQACASNASNK